MNEISLLNCYDMLHKYIDPHDVMYHNKNHLMDKLHYFYDQSKYEISDAFTLKQ